MVGQKQFPSDDNHKHADGIGKERARVNFYFPEKNIVEYQKNHYRITCQKIFNTYECKWSEVKKICHYRIDFTGPAIDQK